MRVQQTLPAQASNVSRYHALGVRFACYNNHLLGAGVPGKELAGFGYVAVHLLDQGFNGVEAGCAAQPGLVSGEWPVCRRCTTAGRGAHSGGSGGSPPRASTAR